MQFVPDGPDIPLPILRAQREGNLMFVVGAGVSAAANLPLFGRLVDQVYEELGQDLPGEPASLATRAEEDARKSGQYDRLIGLLEQRLVYRAADWQQPNNDVRDAVARLLRPRRAVSLSAHADLLDLSRGRDGSPRIVTTNFDTVFERTWKKRTGRRLPSTACAGIPGVGSPDFLGALHLHGRIEDRSLGLGRTDLVLSAPNFGEAYMRNGWASRFVYDLLRRYTLVLVGYAADDPPVRYMLEATEEGRLNFPDLRPAYALVADEAGDSGGLREAWRGKGLQPLIFSAPNRDFSALYRTLRSWADLVRDPLARSEEQLTALANKTFADSTDSEREKFAYLVKEVSSPIVATRQCSDPGWIEALKGESGAADDWTYLIWFRDRLETPEAARYASRVEDAEKIRIARAIDIALRTRREPLSQLYETFWVLFIQAYLRDELSPYGRIRQVERVTTTRIRELAARFEPRLRVERRHSFREIDEPVSPPSRIHDLAHFYFRAVDSDWQSALGRWPQDARAEERLILALDRSLLDACEVAADAGLLGSDGDLMSFDLAMVHAPEDGEGLVDPADRHGINWRLNQPDAHNDRFAPVVRLISGLWRRLAARDPSKARRISNEWALRDEMIFKRLASWAATVSDAGPSDLIEAYLQRTTRERYWTSDNNPEIVRFYCRKWNHLQPVTRARIEAAILKGYRIDHIRRFARAGTIRYLKALYTAREFARIITAGGRLSPNVRTQLASLYDRHANLPREMPILAHLCNPSWSGSGYSADIRVLQSVEDEDLLETAAQIETSDRLEQSDLWQVFVENEPVRALRGLHAAFVGGDFDAHRWRPLLGLYAYREPEQRPEDLPDLVTILGTVAMVASDQLAPLGHVLSTLIERRAKATDDPLFPAILSLWDQLLPAVESVEQADDRERLLSDTVLGSPLATLAASLMTMQSNVERHKGGGFDPVLAPRFAALVALEGRPGVVAKAALMQQLRFLTWLAPEWVDEHLLPSLMAESDEALDLMSVVAHSVAPQNPDLFNLLKVPILRALEHEKTDEAVREQLSGALIGAAISIIGGRGGFDLTPVECRRILTRIPSRVLARMAWELTSLLRGKRNAKNQAKYWDAVIAPFLTRYWPNDVAARTAEVSENLAHLPALAGNAFERAVSTVLGLVRPIARYEIRFGLGLDRESKLITKYPRSALKLIAAVLDLDAPPPSDVNETIQALLDADPGVATEPAFWRLKLLQRPS